MLKFLSNLITSLLVSGSLISLGWILRDMTVGENALLISLKSQQTVNTPKPFKSQETQPPEGAKLQSAQGNGRENLSAIEEEIIRETNRVRTNPTSYIPIMEDWRSRFRRDGKTVEIEPRVLLTTQEGVEAVDEAINYLKQVPAVGSLKPAAGMSEAAQDHVLSQGPTGQIGHNGPDGGMRERIERHGEWSGSIGENISYGSLTGQDVVMQLIIDDGVPDRGHRENIFSPKFKITGVSCGPHTVYEMMCVITYATAFEEQEEVKEQ